MIRIVLLGRTGNHLFQYALGRVLAEKHGVSLVLDASWFNAEGWRDVSHFLKLPLKARVVRRCSLGARVLRKFTGKHYWEYRGISILKESPVDQSFAPRFLAAPADCMLFGYFQTPRYFESIAAGLRPELSELIASGAGQSDFLSDRLGAANSVAVHVRRQDYLTQPIFQVCNSSYYRLAIDHLRARLPGARFFIFSDDPAWCQATFSASDIEMIDSGTAGRNPLHDLRLMSLASHHIIANSTYSWWAAWLGHKPGQQVLMPDRWYAQDIVAPIEQKQCDGWTVVPTRAAPSVIR